MATGLQPLVDAQRDSVTGKLAAEESQTLPPAMREVAAQIAQADVVLMAALPWRGNVAELRAFLEEVIAGLEADRPVAVDGVLRHRQLANRTVVVPEGVTLREARARFEREYVAATLARHRGRISEAAKALGIQRTNLYRKIRVLQLDRTTTTVPGRS
jgi:two-component system nitrogen regulation response regulator NtrX